MYKTIVNMILKYRSITKASRQVTRTYEVNEGADYLDKFSQVEL